MFKIDTARTIAMLAILGVLSCTCCPALAGVHIEGQVQAGGAPVANSTVTLWAASAGEPKQLAQTTTNRDGRFELNSQEASGQDISLYVIAKGGETAVNKGSGKNPAVALLSVLGNTPPPTTRAIQDWLGHRSIQHTTRYTQLSAAPFRDFWRCREGGLDRSGVSRSANRAGWPLRTRLAIFLKPLIRRQERTTKIVPP